MHINYEDSKTLPSPLPLSLLLLCNSSCRAEKRALFCVEEKHRLPLKEQFTFKTCFVKWIAGVKMETSNEGSFFKMPLGFNGCLCINQRVKSLKIKKTKIQVNQITWDGRISYFFFNTVFTTPPTFAKSSACFCKHSNTQTQ